MVSNCIVDGDKNITCDSVKVELGNTLYQTDLFDPEIDKYLRSIKMKQCDQLQQYLRIDSQTDRFLCRFSC